MPQIPGGVEYFPDGTAESMELPRTPEQGRPAQVEQLTQAAQAAPAVATLQVLVPSSTQTPGPQAVSDDDVPVIAGDDDLIEKEWVDKAKKIIALTRGNPYEQAKAIAALQADYLKKRYNRVLGGADQ